MGNGVSRLRRRRLSSTDPGLLYTKPNGLYPTCAWDDKVVRKMIVRRYVAPRFPGMDDAQELAREGCPICFLYYPMLNHTKCCTQGICTECYLQVRPPRHHKAPCPFCKSKRVEVSFSGAKPKAVLDKEVAEERYVRDRQRMVREASRSAPSTDPARPDPPPPTQAPDPHPGAAPAHSAVARQDSCPHHPHHPHGAHHPCSSRPPPPPSPSQLPALLRPGSASDEALPLPWGLPAEQPESLDAPPSEPKAVRWPLRALAASGEGNQSPSDASCVSGDEAALATCFDDGSGASSPVEGRKFDCEEDHRISVDSELKAIEEHFVREAIRQSLLLV